MRDGPAQSRIAALEARIGALEARLAPRRPDATALLDVLRAAFPGGVLFLAREVIAAAESNDARGLALRAELAAARIRTGRQLGRVLGAAGAIRIGDTREGVLWAVR